MSSSVLDTPLFADSVLLTAVFFTAFFLANSWNDVIKALANKYFKKGDEVKDWLLYGLFATVLSLSLLWIMWKTYHHINQK
jgi:type VI protein secretion system component VasK